MFHTHRLSFFSVPVVASSALMSLPSCFQLSNNVFPIFDCTWRKMRKFIVNHLWTEQILNLRSIIYQLIIDNYRYTNCNTIDEWGKIPQMKRNYLRKENIWTSEESPTYSILHSKSDTNSPSNSALQFLINCFSNAILCFSSISTMIVAIWWMLKNLMFWIYKSTKCKMQLKFHQSQDKVNGR